LLQEWGEKQTKMPDDTLLLLKKTYPCP
jgi:hypothetical protein